MSNAKPSIPEQVLGFRTRLDDSIPWKYVDLPLESRLTTQPQLVEVVDRWRLG